MIMGETRNNAWYAEIADFELLDDKWGDGGKGGQFGDYVAVY